MCRAIAGGVTEWFVPSHSEHTTRFAYQDKKRHPRVAIRSKVDMKEGMELIQDIKKEEVIRIMCPRDTELVHPIMTQFVETDEFGYYVDDGKGWLSAGKRLRCARDAYLLEKQAHESTKNEVQTLREQVAELERTLGTTENGEVGEVVAADEVEREGKDDVSVDNGDGDKDLNGNVVPKEEHTKMANSGTCTPQVRAKDGSGSQSNIVTQIKIRPRMRNASTVHSSPCTNPLIGRRVAKLWVLKRDVKVRRVHRNRSTELQNMLVARSVRAKMETQQELQALRADVGFRSGDAIPVEGEESIVLFLEESVIRYPTTMLMDE